MVRCFEGGSLGFFLGNTFGDEDTKSGENKKLVCEEDSKKKRSLKHTRIQLFAPSGVPIYASFGRASNDDVGYGWV